MSYPCGNPDCGYPETGKCVRGFANPDVECEERKAGVGGGSRRLLSQPGTIPPPAPSEEPINAGDEALAKQDEPPYDGTFWSGTALGGDDAASLLTDPHTLLFSIVGGKNRGKTCLLSAFYIQLANGFTEEFKYRFCGSLTLKGFERLTEPAFRWKGDEDEILPRTTQSSYRQPSFLHVALKHENAFHLPARHVLLTDMPGEWFERFAEAGNATITNTLEFLPRSDGVVFVVDAPRAEKDSVYREEIDYLLNRILDEQVKRGSRPPIAITLAKCDQVPSAQPREVSSRKSPEAWGSLGKVIRNIVTQMAREDAPAWDIFPTSAFNKPQQAGVAVLAPFAFLMGQADRSALPQCAKVPLRHHRRFFKLFRAENER